MKEKEIRQKKKEKAWSNRTVRTRKRKAALAEKRRRKGCGSECWFALFLKF
jgi:hypothetical protein